MESDEINRQICEFLYQGVIKSSVSPCGSPIVLILKKDRAWHLCIDFQSLNKINIKN
jgi:hypothetical protein